MNPVAPVWQHPTVTYGPGDSADVIVDGVCHGTGLVGGGAGVEGGGGTGVSGGGGTGVSGGGALVETRGG